MEQSINPTWRTSQGVYDCSFHENDRMKETWSIIKIKYFMQEILQYQIVQMMSIIGKYIC